MSRAAYCLFFVLTFAICKDLLAQASLQGDVNIRWRSAQPFVIDGDAMIHPGERLQFTVTGSVQVNKRIWTEKNCTLFVFCKSVTNTEEHWYSPNQLPLKVILAPKNTTPAPNDAGWFTLFAAGTYVYNVPPDKFDNQLQLYAYIPDSPVLGGPVDPSLSDSVYHVKVDINDNDRAQLLPQFLSQGKRRAAELRRDIILNSRLQPYGAQVASAIVSHANSKYPPSDRSGWQDHVDLLRLAMEWDRSNLSIGNELVSFLITTGNAAQALVEADEMYRTARLAAEQSPTLANRRAFAQSARNAARLAAQQRGGLSTGDINEADALFQEALTQTRAIHDYEGLAQIAVERGDLLSRVHSRASLDAAAKMYDEALNVLPENLPGIPTQVTADGEFLLTRDNSLTVSISDIDGSNTHPLSPMNAAIRLVESDRGRLLVASNGSMKWLKPDGTQDGGDVGNELQGVQVGNGAVIGIDTQQRRLKLVRPDNTSLTIAPADGKSFLMYAIAPASNVIAVLQLPFSSTPTPGPPPSTLTIYSYSDTGLRTLRVINGILPMSIALSPAGDKLLLIEPQPTGGTGAPPAVNISVFNSRGSADPVHFVVNAALPYGEFGTRCSAECFSPDGRELLLPGADYRTLLRVDSATGAVRSVVPIAGISAAAAPFPFAARSVGDGDVYLLSPMSATATLLHLTTGASEPRTVPYGMAFYGNAIPRLHKRADGSLGWATQEVSLNVNIVPLAPGGHVKTVPMAPKTHSLELTPGGRYLICGDVTGWSVLDSETGTRLTLTPAGGAAPAMFGPPVFVAGTHPHQWFRFDGTQMSLTSMTEYSGLTQGARVDLPPPDAAVVSSYLAYLQSIIPSGQPVPTTAPLFLQGQRGIAHLIGLLPLAPPPFAFPATGPTSAPTLLMPYFDYASGNTLHRFALNLPVSDQVMQIANDGDEALVFSRPASVSWLRQSNSQRTQLVDVAPLWSPANQPFDMTAPEPFGRLTLQPPPTGSDRMLFLASTQEPRAYIDSSGKRIFVQYTTSRTPRVASTLQVFDIPPGGVPTPAPCGDCNAADHSAVIDAVNAQLLAANPLLNVGQFSLPWVASLDGSQLLFPVGDRLVIHDVDRDEPRALLGLGLPFYVTRDFAITQDWTGHAKLWRIQ